MVDEFETYLKEQGKRLTRERRIVTKVALLIHGPFTMEAAVKAVSLMSDVRISRATVCRTLQQLTEAELLIKDESAKEPLFRKRTAKRR